MLFTGGAYENIEEEVGIIMGWFVSLILTLIFGVIFLLQLISGNTAEMKGILAIMAVGFVVAVVAQFQQK